MCQLRQSPMSRAHSQRGETFTLRCSRRLWHRAESWNTFQAGCLNNKRTAGHLRESGQGIVTEFISDDETEAWMGPGHWLVWEMPSIIWDTRTSSWHTTSSEVLHNPLQHSNPFQSAQAKRHWMEAENSIRIWYASFVCIMSTMLQYAYTPTHKPSFFFLSPLSFLTDSTLVRVDRLDI